MVMSNCSPDSRHIWPGLRSYLARRRTLEGSISRQTKLRSLPEKREENLLKNAAFLKWTNTLFTELVKKTCQTGHIARFLTCTNACDNVSL